MNKKEKRLALKSALSSRVAEGKLIVLDELKLDGIKTKNLVNIISKNLGVDKALVVLNENDQNVVLSARNLETVKTALTNTINVFDILKYNTVIITKDAVKTVEEVYA
jgi:large subunit ribosomal protein L4